MVIPEWARQWSVPGSLTAPPGARFTAMVATPGQPQVVLRLSEHLWCRKTDCRTITRPSSSGGAGRRRAQVRRLRRHSAVRRPARPANLRGTTYGVGPRCNRRHWRTKRSRCRSPSTMTRSSSSRRSVPTQRSANPFCHGERAAVRNCRMPRLFTRASNALSKRASRSRTRRTGTTTSAPMASTICWAAHAECGCVVALTCSTRRRSSERTKKT
jgi:hypothetical protein